jgi:hypothetical protein
MSANADQLHQRFGRRLLLSAIGWFCFAGATAWMTRIGREDLTQPSAWQMFIVGGCIWAAAFAGFAGVLASALLIYRRARKDPAVLAAFNDEFHRWTERRPSLVALVAVMLVLAALGVVGAFTAALTVPDAVAIALSVSVASFVGAYLYLERET